jgi:hypothetical protein
MIKKRINKQLLIKNSLEAASPPYHPGILSWRLILDNVALKMRAV